MRHLLALVVTVLLLAGCGRGGGDHADRNVDWPHWGNVAENTHFADLAQVDRANVANLRVAWSRAEGTGQYVWETFPIVVGRTMYYDTGTDQVYAVDAATGKVRWTDAPWSTSSPARAWRSPSRSAAGSPTAPGGSMSPPPTTS